MSRSQKSFIACMLLGACMVALPLLAQRAQKGRQFGETVEVLTIELPVQVIADGEPVKGLTAENFEIYDGRRRQNLTGFEVVDLSESGSDGRSLPIGQVPISARRHFLLLFDFAFAEPTAVGRARDAAQGLVANELHPTDLVAVATYSRLGPQLILGFTSDRNQIQLAIETLGHPELVKKEVDPLSLVLDPDLMSASRQGQELAGAAEDVEVGGGRGGQFEAIFKDMSIGFNRAARGEAQGQITAMTTAFEDMAKALHDVQGRKHVVLLSEGFDASLVTGTQDAGRAMEIAASASTGQYWEVDSEERYGSTGTLTAINNMLEEFRRADCAIQAVDIGGLKAGAGARAASGGGAGQDGLFMMANGTGGEMYRNFNDLGVAMEEMLERTSVTYVLAFQPTNVKPNGDYHKLRVELKDAPRGARVVHRPGFYAPRPYGERSGLEKQLEAAERILSGREGGVLGASLLAAPFRAEGGRGYVPVLLEIDGPTLLAGLSDDTATLEIYVYAIAEDGTVGDYLSQNMGLDVAKVRPALEQSGLKFFGDLELMPGEYLLRALVRDAQNGHSVTRTVSVTVPEFGSGSPTLAMPLFPETPGKWLVVQEAAGAEARKERPYPFTLGGNPFMPAARPLVAATGEAQFIVVAYNVGDGAIPLETQLITAEGKTVEEGRISFVSRDQGATPGATQLLLKLETNGLAAGEYRLVTSLQGQETSTSIPFVVAEG